LEHQTQFQDINPIEDVWKVLKIRVNARPDHLRNLDQLWDLLQEEWKKINIDFINGLVASMPHEAETVYRTKGGSTKYSDHS
jgi:RNAse (barnase) inhibitor barstar